MGYDPSSNTFVPLDSNGQSLDPKKAASPGWTKFQVDEVLVLKGIAFRLKEVGENRLVLRPIGKL